MKISDTKIWIIIIVVGTLIGIIFSSLYGFIGLAWCAVFFLFCILVFFVIGLFTKRSHFIRIAGYIFFLFLLASISSFTTLRLKYNSRKSCSEKVISALENFRKTNRRYPAEIKDLRLDDETRRKFLATQLYNVDTRGQIFYISFNSDGATTYTYNSEDRTWTYDGFEL